jgi:hypothetical protein
MKRTRSFYSIIRALLQEVLKAAAHPFEVGEAPPDHFLLAHVLPCLPKCRSRHHGRVVDWKLLLARICCGRTAYTKRKAPALAQAAQV